MNEKSILEQALLQVNTLEEAVKQNAKGILSSVMKQELNDLLKESQMEEEEEVKSEEVAEEASVEEEKSQPEEEEKDMSEQPEDEDDDESESDEVEPENADDLDKDEPVKGLDDLDSDMGDEEGDLPSFEPSMGDEESDDDVMDMTGASDDEVLKVFKAMKPEDGVVVKKDGNHVELETGDDEFIIKLDEEEESKEESVDEESLYEIELDEEEESKEEEAKEEEVKEEKSKDEEEVKEVEATEAARTKSNPHGNKGGADRAGLPSKKTYKAGSGVFGINEEVESLKKQNAEYKKALVLFKEKLNEVAVFNASLAYATRLFTEHTTTKQEKLNILKRFDSVSNMNESKNLFSTIKNELENRTPISESVVEKISTSPTSSSTEVLSESKAYENPQFRRMKDLMSKIK